LFIFFAYFVLKLDEPFRNKIRKFYNQFLVDILPLGSGSVDPYIFADLDPDPGSQNLADP